MKIYRGRRLEPEAKTASAVEVVVVDRPDGGGVTGIYPLEHRVRHSPTGFAWGYGGSGPADLARSLCWDLLGEEPEPALYQFVKFRLVGSWTGPEWTLTEGELREVIGEYRAKVAQQAQA